MALTEVLALFTMDVSGLLKAGKVADGAIGQITGQLKKLGGMLVGGAVLDGIKSIAKELIDQGGALNDTSAQLGINTDALQAWQFAAGQGGVEAGEMNKAFLVLEKNMAKAAAGGAKTGGAFATLGVQLRDAKGAMRATEDVLTDTGLAIAKLKSPQERTAAAMEVFGKAGAKLNPLFAEGEAGLKKMLGEVKRLGGGFSQGAIASLDDLGDQMARFDMAMTSAKVKIFTAFAPAMTELVGWLTGSVAAFAASEDGSAMLTAGVTALGVAGAAAGVAFLAPWLPLITTLTFVGLLVQDFIVGLNGGESLIGRVFDKLFGKGAGKTFFEEAKKDLQAMVAWLKEAFDWVKKLTGTGSSAERGRMMRKKFGVETAADRAAASDEEALKDPSLSPQTRAALQDAQLTRRAQAAIDERDTEDATARGGVKTIRSWDPEANSELSGTNMVDAFKKSMADNSLLGKFKDALAEGADTTAIPTNPLQAAIVGLGTPTATPSTSKGDVSQTNHTQINITTSDDPDAIGEAAGSGVAGAHRGAADALRRTGG